MNTLDDNLVKSFWHFIGHKSELASKNDYISLKIYDTDVVVFNDNGQLVAFDNICPHRGGKFFPHGFSNQIAQCPYHGWTYRNGKLNVSRKGLISSLGDKCPNINKYSIDMCGDFIFVAINPARALKQQLNGVWDLLFNISLQIEHRLDINQYIYESPWQVAVENALESYHIGFVHPNTLARLSLTEGEDLLFDWASVWESKVGDERANKSLTRINDYFNLTYQYPGYLFIYLFPFSMISSTFGYSYSLQNFFPLSGSTKTSFTSRLLQSKLKNEKSKLFLDQFFANTATTNRLVFKEDHDICKRVDPNSWSSQPLEYYSISEKKIMHFRALIRQSSGIGVP